MKRVLSKKKPLENSSGYKNIGHPNQIHLPRFTNPSAKLLPSYVANLVSITLLSTLSLSDTTSFFLNLFP